MNLNPCNLHIAVISDIHLGHRRNTTIEIISNLKKAFPDNAETAKLDIIFLAGDIYDTLLSLPTDDVWEIKIWIALFLRICKKYDIMVRVLEGTPSHDWKQSELFVSMNETAKIGADLKYVKDLSIEYIERFNINVLYVPDEWESTTDNTLMQVKDLIRAKGLTKVDYAIMHGNFGFQLPSFIKAQKHDEAEYLNLVKELIFIGHVHLHNQFERIIAQGSFDRLAHGEEGPKGHVRATITANGDHNIVFVETLGAKIFKTVKCSGMSLDDTLDEIDIQIGTLPEGSMVRIEADYDNPIFSNMEAIIRLHPFFTFSKLVRKTEEEEKEIVEDAVIFVPITITRSNIAGLLLERLASSGASGAIMESAEDILKEVI